MTYEAGDGSGRVGLCVGPGSSFAGARGESWGTGYCMKGVICEGGGLWGKSSSRLIVGSVDGIKDGGWDVRHALGISSCRCAGSGVHRVRNASPQTRSALHDGCVPYN